MKKFLRNLFSGYFLVLLVLLIEIVLIVYCQFFLKDTVSALITKKMEENGGQLELASGLTALVYMLLRVASFIIALIIFFKIINKAEDPEFKIPWIVFMLLMPVFTSVMFLIFGNHGLRKKDRKIIDGSRKGYSPHFELSPRTEYKYENELGRAAGAFNYINNITQLGIHTNNRVTYYKCGEEFFPAFIEGLKRAKEFIFIEFFIIADGKEWSAVQEVLKQKAQEGVEVRIIYDDMGCGGTISSRTPRILRKYGIKCHKFHPFRPILSGVYNNRDHRKIVVIDHQMAFTGGINLADEYANEIERFGYWKDTMVKIEGSAINNLIATFLQNYNLCVNKISNYDHYLTYEPPRRCHSSK